MVAHRRGNGRAATSSSSNNSFGKALARRLVTKVREADSDFPQLNLNINGGLVDVAGRPPLSPTKRENRQDIIHIMHYPPSTPSGGGAATATTTEDVTGKPSPGQIMAAAALQQSWQQSGLYASLMKDDKMSRDYQFPELAPSESVENTVFTNTNISINTDDNIQHNHSNQENDIDIHDDDDEESNALYTSDVPYTTDEEKSARLLQQLCWWRQLSPKEASRIASLPSYQASPNTTRSASEFMREARQQQENEEEGDKNPVVSSTNTTPRANKPAAKTPSPSTPTSSSTPAFQTPHHYQQQSPSLGLLANNEEQYNLEDDDEASTSTLSIIMMSFQMEEESREGAASFAATKTPSPQVKPGSAFTFQPPPTEQPQPEQQNQPTEEEEVEEVVEEEPQEETTTQEAEDEEESTTTLSVISELDEDGNRLADRSPFRKEDVGEEPVALPSPIPSSPMPQAGLAIDTGTSMFMGKDDDEKEAVAATPTPPSSIPKSPLPSQGLSLDTSRFLDHHEEETAVVPPNPAATKPRIPAAECLTIDTPAAHTTPTMLRTPAAGLDTPVAQDTTPSKRRMPGLTIDTSMFLDNAQEDNDGECEEQFWTPRAATTPSSSATHRDRQRALQESPIVDLTEIDDILDVLQSLLDDPPSEEETGSNHSQERADGTELQTSLMDRTIEMALQSLDAPKGQVGNPLSEEATTVEQTQVVGTPAEPKAPSSSLATQGSANAEKAVGTPSRTPPTKTNFARGRSRSSAIQARTPPSTSSKGKGGFRPTSSPRVTPSPRSSKAPAGKQANQREPLTTKVVQTSTATGTPSSMSSFEHSTGGSKAQVKATMKQEPSSTGTAQSPVIARLSPADTRFGKKLRLASRFRNGSFNRATGESSTGTSSTQSSVPQPSTDGNMLQVGTESHAVGSSQFPTATETPTPPSVTRKPLTPRSIRNSILTLPSGSSSKAAVTRKTPDTKKIDMTGIYSRAFKVRLRELQAHRRRRAQAAREIQGWYQANANDKREDASGSQLDMVTEEEDGSVTSTESISDDTSLNSPLHRPGSAATGQESPRSAREPFISLSWLGFVLLSLPIIVCILAVGAMFWAEEDLVRMLPMSKVSTVSEDVDDGACEIGVCHSEDSLW